MNISSLHSCFSNTQNSIQSLILRCARRRQVHPEIFIPKDLEFVNLGSQRIIRVLHLPAQQSIKTVVASTNGYDTLNDEVHKILEVPTEDYWFTRSNRPFKYGDVCNCALGTPAGHGATSKAWKDVTNSFTEKVKTENYNAPTRESVVRGDNNVVYKFADYFTQVVLDEAYGLALSMHLNVGSTVVNKNFIPSSKPFRYSESESKNKSLSDPGNFSPRVETVVQVHHGDIGNLNDVLVIEDSLQSKNCKNSSTHSSGDGIVNLSFSGTLSEPDDFESPIIGDGQIVYSSPKRLDTSNVNVKIFSSDVTYSSSEANKNFENYNSENLATCERDKLEGLPHCIDQKFSGDFRNDDSAGVLNAKLIECGKSKIDASKVSIGDFMDKITKKKADTERCCNSETIQKPSLLFLHGAGSSADIWALQLQYFSFVGYEVIAPDMLGHGYSSAPDIPSAYAFDKLLEDVLQIFDRFILGHKKCVIIGHSYGSSFAAAVARYRPQQVVQLVLLSSGGPSPLVPNEAFFSFPSCVMSLMRPFLMCGFKRDLFYGPRGKHLQPCCAYELPPNVLKHVEKGQQWTEGDAAFHRRITIPTLLVHGLKDPYISLVEECEMERTIPRSYLEVISNAGHMLMLDTPEQLCHMIHSFITWWNSSY